MKASEPDPAAHRLNAPAAAGWLLIGNSRWHWALPSPGGLHCRHEAPPAPQLLPGHPPPGAWAAVGAVPPWSGLQPERRLTLAAVPLRAMPPWLGIDRALAGWKAWADAGGWPVLVADAGTVLSLTRVSAGGAFAGGRLLPGLALQLRAMAQGTAALPALPAPHPAAWPGGGTWPRQTGAAMLQGSLHGLVAAIAAASAELWSEEPEARLVLTGGDGALLWPLLQPQLAAAERDRAQWRQDLCLEALAALRPGPFS